MNRLQHSLLALALVAGCGSSGDGEPACDAEAVQRALDRASTGATVRLGECTLDAALRVPVGVTLMGAGPSTLLRAPDGSSALTLMGEGASAASLSVVAGASEYAVTVTGGSLADVTVSVERGGGVAVLMAPTARLSRVSIEGGVDAASGADVPRDASAAAHPTIGLLVDASGAESSPVTLDGVEVSGFVEAGAYLLDSHVAWQGGGATGNRSVGLLASGGSADLRDLDLGATWSGTYPIAYGGVLLDGTFVSTDLAVEAGEGYGLLHDGGDARHQGLVAAGNGEAAVWAQSEAALELTAGTLTDNTIGGVVAVSASRLTLRDTTVTDTRTAPSVDDLFGRIDLGDGVQLVSTGELTLERLSLTGNGRVGLLIELDGGALAGATIDEVEVDVPAGGLGAILQGGAAPAGWDDGVIRSAAAAAADAEVTDPLAFASVRARDVPTRLPTPCD